MKSVTVVIPNWNGMKYLKTCLDALRNQDTDDFETLVVDNHSADGSVAFIRENYPEVRLLIHEENLGFTGGVNAGIEASKTPFVLLLNNDTECDPGFVRNLLQAIQKDPKIFSVSSKMIRFYERNTLDDAGDYYTALGYQAQRLTGYPVTDKRASKPCKVFSSCAGAAIYRRLVFEEIGLFDPNHFAYLEDIDVGYRAMIYGYRNLYEPSAVVYHVGSGTSGAVQYTPFKVMLSARNNQYLLYKNMPPFFRGLNALPLALGRAVKRRFFSKLGFREAYEEGLAAASEHRKDLKIVPCDFVRFFRHVRIEGLLIVYAFRYAGEFFGRKKLKKGLSGGGKPAGA
ncbi:MAG: glycosyltransferase family 2 protein [Lachnospiraceae bacterium]|nr:glycosyltransferase family 2 protein [Lachnospiraceae bacterium]